jgi:hypothetical protein
MLQEEGNMINMYRAVKVQGFINLLKTFTNDQLTEYEERMNQEMVTTGMFQVFSHIAQEKGEIMTDDWQQSLDETAARREDAEVQLAIIQYVRDNRPVPR